MYADTDKESIGNVDPVVWVAALTLANDVSDVSLAGMARMLAGVKMGFTETQEAIDYIHDQVWTVMLNVEYDVVNGVAIPKWETLKWNEAEEENLWSMFSFVMGLQQEITECPDHLKHIV